jgi:hypothetical protein
MSDFSDWFTSPEISSRITLGIPSRGLNLSSIESLSTELPSPRAE